MNRWIEYRKQQRNENGAMLIMALVFVAACGLGLSAILSLAHTNLRTTEITQNHEQALYANDAGLELGIQKARTNNTWCNNAGLPSQSITYPGTVDGHSVTVACEVANGFYDSTSGNPYGIFTTSPGAGSLTTDNGGTPVIKGNVYVNGSMNLNNLQVEGDLLQSSACQTNHGTVTETYSCGIADIAKPTFTLPTTAPSDAPTAVAAPGCKVLFPGRYRNAAFSSQLDLGGSNYLVSGVYYIENAGNIDLNKATIIGGSNWDDTADPANSGATACASDTNPAYSSRAKGKGVTLIFGGSTRLTIGNQDNVELFYRRPAAGESGSSGISLYVVPDNTVSDFLKSSITSQAIEVRTGASPVMSFHGIIYAPENIVDIFASNNTIIAAKRGVVASVVNLKTSGSVNSGFLISAASTTVEQAPFQVVVTSTATNADGRIEKARAVVTISNGPTHTSHIESWRTVGVS